MLWIATAMLLAADSPAPPLAAAPDRQARASVRIVRAARVQLGKGAAEIGEDQQTAITRESRIVDEAGLKRPAVLLEFP